METTLFFLGLFTIICASITLLVFEDKWWQWAGFALYLFAVLTLITGVVFAILLSSFFFFLIGFLVTITSIKVGIDFFTSPLFLINEKEFQEDAPSFEGQEKEKETADKKKVEKSKLSSLLSILDTKAENKVSDINPPPSFENEDEGESLYVEEDADFTAPAFEEDADLTAPAFEEDADFIPPAFEDEDESEKDLYIEDNDEEDDIFDPFAEKDEENPFADPYSK